MSSRCKLRIMSSFICAFASTASFYFNSRILSLVSSFSRFSLISFSFILYISSFFCFWSPYSLSLLISRLLHLIQQKHEQQQSKTAVTTPTPIHIKISYSSYQSLKSSFQVVSFSSIFVAIGVRHVNWTAPSCVSGRMLVPETLPLKPVKAAVCANSIVRDFIMVSILPIVTVMSVSLGPVFCSERTRNLNQITPWDCNYPTFRYPTSIVLTLKSSFSNW